MGSGASRPDDETLLVYISADLERAERLLGKGGSVWHPLSPERVPGKLPFFANLMCFRIRTAATPPDTATRPRSRRCDGDVRVSMVIDGRPRGSGDEAGDPGPEKVRT